MCVSSWLCIVLLDARSGDNANLDNPQGHIGRIGGISGCPGDPATTFMLLQLVKEIPQLVKAGHLLITFLGRIY